MMTGLMVITIAGTVFGIILYLITLPYLVFLFRSEFYNSRFRSCLRLPAMDKTTTEQYLRIPKKGQYDSPVRGQGKINIKEFVLQGVTRYNYNLIMMRLMNHLIVL